MKCDELKIEYVGYGMGFYPTEKVDAAIDELKDELNNQKWRGDEWARNANDKDKQIAELKARINELESIPHTDNSAVIDALETENAELKAENRRLKKKMDEYHLMSDIRRAKIKELKRALWLARAERADDRARIFYFYDLETMLDIDGYSYDSQKKKGHKKLTARLWRIIWLKVERKCRAKAEEYK